VRVFAVEMPVVMALAVESANHFVLDVVGGGVLVMIGLLVAMAIAPSSDDPPLDAPAAFDHARTVRSPSRAVSGALLVGFALMLALTDALG